MNDAGIVYGAIGVSNPDDTFGPRVRQGNPFLFLFHTLLQSAASLPVVRCGTGIGEGVSVHVVHSAEVLRSSPL